MFLFRNFTVGMKSRTGILKNLSGFLDSSYVRLGPLGGRYQLSLKGQGPPFMAFTFDRATLTSSSCCFDRTFELLHITGAGAGVGKGADSGGGGKGAAGSAGAGADTEAAAGSRAGAAAGAEAVDDIAAGKTASADNTDNASGTTDAVAATTACADGCEMLRKFS